MKYGAVVVLYNPTGKEIERARQYTHAFSRVYCLDNSEEDHQDSFKALPQIKYEHFSSNMGLGFAYNYAIHLAVEEKTDYLCLLDQDSCFDSEAIKCLMKCIETDELCRETALYVPQICTQGKKCVISDKVEDVEWAINSGSFINLSLISRYGIYYDENYFLDRLDRDYCKQISGHNLRIRRCGRSILQQQLGEIYHGKLVHSPIRNYYCARNRLYYNKKYEPIQKRIALDVALTVRHLKDIIFTGKDVQENVMMVYRGIRDHLKGRYGRYSRL